MAKFLIKNISTQIDGFLGKEAYFEISDALSYAVQGAEYSDRVQKGEWDGKIRLLKKSDRSFPTGAISIVFDILEKRQMAYEIVDCREKPKVTKVFKINKKYKIRGYQAEIVQTALIYSRGLIQAATGSGKSFIIALILARLGLPSIVYVNTKDLLYQMMDNLKTYIDTDEDIVGQIGDGIINPKLFTVATVQSVHKALDIKYVKFDEEDDLELEVLDDKNKQIIQKCVVEANVAIIDETHALASATFQMIANNSVNAFYKFGLSGTPWREDNADILLTAASGKKIYNITASQLTRMGYLTRAYIVRAKIPKAIEAKEYNVMSYPGIYKAQVTNNAVCNQLICDIASFCYRNDKTVLILVQHIAHGEFLLSKLKSIIDFEVAGEIKEEGSKKKSIKIREIEFLKGPVRSDKRKRTLELFRERKVKIVIATSLADQGLDVPSLDGVILAGRGKSSTRVPQRVGRVIRLFESKFMGFVFDFHDPVKYLRDHSMKRLEIYQSEPEWIIDEWDFKKQSNVEAFLKELFFIKSVRNQ